jgi:hypothetical protein
MTLFSWFINDKKVNNLHNKEQTFKREEKQVNELRVSNTMWPSAKVRKKTLVSQQEYINTSLKKENAKELENIRPFFKES